MRTTVDLDDELLGWARERARALGTTLTAVLEEGLATLKNAPPAPARPFHFPTVRGEYIGGVDLSDRDALYEVMGE